MPALRELRRVAPARRDPRRCCRATSKGKPIEPTIRSSREQRDSERAVGVLRQPRPSGNSRSNSSRELANAAAGSRRLGDRRPGLQWQAKAGRQGRAPHAAGIDDHELAVVDEAEGAADGAEERRHALDEGVRHLVGGRSRRELRRQRPEGVRLGLDLGARSAPADPGAVVRSVVTTAASCLVLRASSRPAGAFRARRERLRSPSPTKEPTWKRPFRPHPSILPATPARVSREGRIRLPQTPPLRPTPSPLPRSRTRVFPVNRTPLHPTRHPARASPFRSELGEVSEAVRQ